MSLFGDRLKEARKNANLTQQELADAIGVTKMCICGYESGTRCPRGQSAAKTYAALGRALGVSPSYLMGLDDAVAKTITAKDALSKKERELISAYRNADKSIRGAINVMLGIK